MARLTWQNVDAPNFTSVADMYSVAGNSLGKAFEGLGNSLSGFREVQRQQASLPALDALSRITDEASAAKALETIRSTINPLDRTAGLQEAMLGASKLGLDLQSNRADMNINLAENNRTQETHDTSRKRDAELALLTKPAMQASESVYWDTSQGGDPRAYLGGLAVGGAAARGDSFTGMDDRLASGTAALISNAPPDVQKELRVTSGYRSPETQAGIIAKDMGKYGFSAEDQAAWVADVGTLGPEAAGQKWAKRFSTSGLRKNIGLPGGSNHQKGSALDLQQNFSPATEAYLAENVGKYGLHRPMGHEPWHLEVVGSRGTPPGGIRLSDYVGPGTSLRPSDVTGLVDDIYTDQRTVLGNVREDRQKAREEQEYQDGLLAAEVADQTIREAGNPNDIIATIDQREDLPLSVREKAKAIASQTDLSSRNVPSLAGSGLDANTARLDQDAEVNAQELVLELDAANSSDKAYRVVSKAQQAFGDLSSAAEISKKLAEGDESMTEDSIGRMNRMIDEVSKTLQVSPAVAAALLVETHASSGIAPLGKWIDGTFGKLQGDPDAAMKLAEAVGLTGNIGGSVRAANMRLSQVQQIQNQRSLAAELKEQIRYHSSRNGDGSRDGTILELRRKLNEVNQGVLSTPTKGNLKRAEDLRNQGVALLGDALKRGVRTVSDVADNLSNEEDVTRVAMDRAIKDLGLPEDLKTTGITPEQLRQWHEMTGGLANRDTSKREAQTTSSVADSVSNEEAAARATMDRTIKELGLPDDLETSWTTPEELRRWREMMNGLANR